MKLNDFSFSQLSLFEKCAVFLVGLLIGTAWFIYLKGQENTSQETAREQEQKIWYPADFYSYDENLAWKYSNTGGVDFAVRIQVISREGCPISLHGQISFKDSNGVIYAQESDVLSNIPANTKAALVFPIPTNWQDGHSFTEPALTCM